MAASAFIAGGLYLAAALVAGLGEVTAAWYQAGAACVAGALMLTLLNVTLRCLRWGMFLRKLGHDLPFSVNFPIYLAGLSLTTVPGKLGELIRSFFLHQHGVPYSKSIAAFFADRLSDLMGVLLVAGCLSWLLYPPTRFLVVFAIGLGVALAVFRTGCRPLAGLLLRIAPRSWRAEERLAGLVAMFEHLRACLSLPVFGAGVLVGTLAYSAQALALVFMVRALAADVAPEAVFLSFLLSTLGGAASMLPGGLGSMEAALVALLAHFGVPPPSAVAATVLIRLTTLWFVVALGLGCLIWLQLRVDLPNGARPGTPP